MLRLREFSVPLARPLVTARGAVEARDGFLVRVGGDDEPGVGEATPLAGWTESRGACQTALRAAGDRLAEGADTTEVLTAMTETPAARHGLSLALADSAARRSGHPLYRTLGTDRTVESVTVNATLGDAPEADTVEAASRAVDDGFGCLKLKVGARPLGEDLDRVAAVREAAGPAVELRVDANAAWSPGEARRALGELAVAGVSYVEQPLSATDLDGHAALRGGPVAIGLDESLAEQSVATILAADAADVLILKPMSLGGIDRAREAATAARAAGVEPVVSTTVDAVVARTAAVHLAASLAPLPPCGLATAEWLDGDVGPDPAPIDGGAVAVPQGSGTGVELSWGA